MPSLLDTLDRFNYTSSSIRSLIVSQPSRADPGPFTASILDLTLQDLLREADEAEYGLFSFVKEPSDIPLDAGQGKVGRRVFRGATPLKTKRVASTHREEEPEVYVEAALKYLDRFQAVKPMPNARTQLEFLIDRLNQVRDNIDRLQTSIEETTQTSRASPNGQAAEEERRITELKSRILQLRKRKEALATKLPATSRPHPQSIKTSSRPAQAKSKIPSPSTALNSPSSAVFTPTSQPSYAKPKPKPKPRGAPSEKPRARVPGPPAGTTIPKGSDSPGPILRTREDGELSEDKQLFWSGGKPLRIFGKSKSLLDEELDLSGMDALMSPPPAIPRSSRVPIAPTDEADDAADGQSAMNTDDENDGASDFGEPTIVISKLPLEPTPVTTPPSPPPSRPESQSSVVEPQTPVQPAKPEPRNTAPSSTKTKVPRVRITADVERVCAKIWSTISDLLVPGNNFSFPGKRPPNAKDTLAILQTIAAQPIPDSSSNNPSSPSTRSTLSSLLGIESSGPAIGTPHQIMTAHVLLSLLTAPSNEIPLTVLKAILVSKTAVPLPGPEAGREAKQNAAALGASTAQAGTRALYGCVAKKIVKIDRGGGEQIVKFDRV